MLQIQKIAYHKKCLIFLGALSFETSFFKSFLLGSITSLAWVFLLCSTATLITCHHCIATWLGMFPDIAISLTRMTDSHSKNTVNIFFCYELPNELHIPRFELRVDQVVYLQVRVRKHTSRFRWPSWLCLNLDVFINFSVRPFSNISFNWLFQDIFRLH